MTTMLQTLPDWLRRSPWGRAEERKISEAREAERMRLAAELARVEKTNVVKLKFAKEEAAAAGAAFHEVDVQYRPLAVVHNRARGHLMLVSCSCQRDLEKIRRELAELAPPEVEAAIVAVEKRIREKQRVASGSGPEQLRLETELEGLRDALDELRKLKGSPLPYGDLLAAVAKVADSLAL